MDDLIDRILTGYVILILFLIIPITVVISLGLWLLAIQVVGSLLFGWPFPTLVNQCH